MLEIFCFNQILLFNANNIVYLVCVFLTLGRFLFKLSS